MIKQTTVFSINPGNIKRSLLALLIFASTNPLQASTRAQLEETIHEQRRYNPCAVALMSTSRVMEGVNSRALSISGYNPYEFTDMEHIAERVLLPDYVVQFTSKLIYDLNPQATNKDHKASFAKALTVLRAVTATKWMRSKERQLRDLGIITATLDDVADLETFYALRGPVMPALHAVFARAHYRVTTLVEQQHFRETFNSLMGNYNSTLLALPTIDRRIDIDGFKSLNYEDQQFVLMQLKNYYQLSVLYQRTPGTPASRISPQHISYGALVGEVVKSWLITVVGSRAKARELLLPWTEELSNTQGKKIARKRLMNWLR